MKQREREGLVSRMFRAWLLVRAVADLPGHACARRDCRIGVILEERMFTQVIHKMMVVEVVVVRKVGYNS